LKIEAYRRADGAVLDRVRELEGKCRDFDKTKGSISLDSSLNVYPDMNCLFLLYEGETLLSVLTIFMPTAEFAEISACTSPEHRRRGCFGLLLKEARKELEKYGSPRLIFVVDSDSRSGAEAMDALNCKPDFTEYLMSYQESDVPLNPDAAQIRLLRAERGDIESLARLGMKIFSESYEDAKSQISNTLASENRIQYLAVLGEKPVGLGAVSFDGLEASIYGLGISPEHRGKGYGRELLLLIISDIKRKGDYKITLEVDSRNDIAVKMYRKNGFAIERAINYYREA